MIVILELKYQLQIIATQWFAVGIIGAAVAICFILLFAIGWIEVELKFGQEWELGRRVMPEYVFRLIAYKVLNEKRKGAFDHENS